MDMPCVCDCGEVFDLKDGNQCDECGKIFCTECVEKPFELCPNCFGFYDKRLQRELENE